MWGHKNKNNMNTNSLNIQSRYTNNKRTASTNDHLSSLIKINFKLLIVQHMSSVEDVNLNGGLFIALDEREKVSK